MSTQLGVPGLPPIRLPDTVRVSRGPRWLTVPNASKPGVHNHGSVPGALRACNGDGQPWVTRHTPPTQICTQDTEESVVAHFSFLEQINFPPQPSSVEIAVCPDTRDGKINIRFCRFYWSRPHSPAVLPGAPGAWPCSQRPVLPPQRQPSLCSGLSPGLSSSSLAACHL